MKPLLFLWITSLLSINIIPASTSTNCSEAFSCGGVHDVKFPFWGGSRPSKCGWPDLELSCQQDIPRFTTNSMTYRLLSFNSSIQNLITVARDDYFNTICPSDPENTTFDPTVFSFGGAYVNMTLFYGCKGSVSGLSSELCENGGDIVYYVDETAYNDACSSQVIIPIFKTFVASVMSNQMTLQQALYYGFPLQWDVDRENCTDCIKSNKECGYDRRRQFTCFSGAEIHTPSGGANSSSGGANGTHTEKGNGGANVTHFGKGNNGADGAHITSYSDANIFEKALLIPLGFFVAIIILIGNVIRRKAKAIKNDQHIVEFMRNQEALATKKYSYSDVKKMTNKFAHKLGQGGFGSVYKGKLLDGRHVAVKLLGESRENGEDFMNEIASISRTSHINVVSLLGFCYEGSKKALIYEFMSNGSLDKFIYTKGASNMKNNLEWNTLYEITVGIARGLEYLHRGCNMRILHLDIKPHNILLDDKFCPKISDFGLAKLCNRDNSAISMLGARGTIGYIAPEVLSRNFGRVSYKSDVYSYGMMVFEMVGARNGTDFGVSHTSSEVYFPDHIYKSLEAGRSLKVDGITDEEEEKIFKQMVLVGLWCIQTHPSERPSMTKVLEMLEGSLDSLPFPPFPFMSSSPKFPPRSDGSYSTTT